MFSYVSLSLLQHGDYYYSMIFFWSSIKLLNTLIKIINKIIVNTSFYTLIKLFFPNQFFSLSWFLSQIYCNFLLWPVSLMELIAHPN
jgi:hypothetical protein